MNLIACFFNEPQIKVKIMYAGNLCSQHFAGKNQVSEVSFCIMLISKTITIFIKRRVVILPFKIFNIDGPVYSKKHTIPAISGWHHAIEHIHAKADGLQYIHRRPYSHQLSLLIRRKHFITHFNHFIHFLFGFAYI